MGHRYKQLILALAMLLPAPLLNFGQGTYTPVRSYPTLATLNTIPCSTTNPSGLPTAGVTSDGSNNGPYWCSATNTWSQITGGGGGGGAGVKNPNGNEWWVGTGYTFTTVDALTETLTGGNYMIHDTNCTGTHLVGDDWTVDPFNPTSGANLHLIVTYGPCKYPLAIETPIAIGQSSQLYLFGDNGFLSNNTTGGAIIVGPSFPGKINSAGPTLGSGPFGSVSATSSGCGGHTFGSTTTIDIEATYYQLAPTNGLLLSGVNGVTLPGTAQTALTVNSGQCATYTAPSAGSFPTNAVGMSLFATVTTLNTWAWEGNVAPGGTITFPTAQGVTTGLNPSPDPPGYNTSGAAVYIGKRNENASISGNLQFGAVFQGAIDANGLANGCLLNVGGEELSGPYKAVCRNPAGQFGMLVEGYNGSISSPNSFVNGIVYDASTCSVSHPCGQYPDGTGGSPITSTQEATIASVIIDQLQSFRGVEDCTMTPDSSGGPTLYDLLVVGTTSPEATVPATGALITRCHGEGPASGSHMLAHFKACGAGISVLHVNGNSKNVVDLDDLQSAACQAAAPNAYAGATPFSQPSYASDLSDVVPYASTSAVVDHTTGYSSTAGSFLAHYWVGNTATAWCSSVGNQCGAFNVNQALQAGSTWGSATGVAGTFVGDSHGSTVVDFQTHAGGTHSGVWVDGSGNLNLAGNNFTLGASSQSTASFLRLYGSASGTNTNPSYVSFVSNDATEGTSLAGPGLTTAGTLCTSSGTPTGDCTITATSKHEIVTFATGTAPQIGNCAKFTTISNLVEVGDGGNPCVTKVMLSSPYTNSTTSPTAIWSSIPVLASTNYVIHCQGEWKAAASGYFAITVVGPASPTNVNYNFTKCNTLAANACTNLTFNATGSTYPTSIGTTAVGSAATDMPFDFTINLNNGTTAGNISITGFTVSTDTLTVETGSACTVN